MRPKLLWVLLVPALAAPGLAETIVCEPGQTEQAAEVCTHTRDLTVWFGTLTVIGAPAPSIDFVELSDIITGDIGNAIFLDPAVDARVRTVSALSPFVDPTLGDMDWVTGVPQNLNAQQNLLDDFAAEAGLLDGAFGSGSLDILSSALSLGPTNYVLTQWETTGTCPALCSITNIGDARVTYFEQNATWTAPPSPVPEPADLAVILGACLSLIAARRRRISR